MFSTRIADLLVGRRQAIFMAGGALAGAAAFGSSAPKTFGRMPLDFDIPRDNLYSFGKLFGTFGPEAVYPTFRGVCFASIGDAALRPLFGYQGMTTLRMDLLPNGHLRWWGKEIAFYTDLVTGQPLDVWTNPYTGERCEVMHFLNNRQLIELTDRMPTISFPDDPKAAAGGPQGAANRKDPGAFVLPWFRQDDMLQMTLEHMLRYRNPLDPGVWRKESTGQFINPAEHYMFFGSVGELEDRSRHSAHFTGGFMRVAPWFPWMMMGQVPGVLTIRAYMWKRTFGLDNVPAGIRDHVAQRYPEFLKVPTEWSTTPNPSSWEMFRESRQPAR